MISHSIFYTQPHTFAGWPANNGAWAWGDELLVGFTVGAYVIQPGHRIAEPYANLLARSLDGGKTWTTENPVNFVGRMSSKSQLNSPIDFSHPGFALRVFSTAYHGCEDPEGGFFYSLDRGQSWQGPHPFTGLIPQVEEFYQNQSPVFHPPSSVAIELTPRTDYLVESSDQLLIQLSVRQADAWGSDRVFSARTRDGGRSFDFISWMVPPTDPYRGVMPSTARLSDGRLVSAVRRRNMEYPDGWIDCYYSSDQAGSWIFLSKVGDCGEANGNPPALVLLPDGRLACAYGNRTKRQMLLRFSLDGGESWGDEMIIRQGDIFNDFGYPRLLVRADGSLVLFYYWADAELPEQHITATIIQL